MNSTYPASTATITPKFLWPGLWARLKRASKNTSKENDHGRRKPSRGAAHQPGIQQPTGPTTGGIAERYARVRALQEPKKYIHCDCGVSAGCRRVVLVALSEQL